jgi:hypothetical protein
LDTIGNLAWKRRKPNWKFALMVAGCFTVTLLAWIGAVVVVFWIAGVTI